MKEGIFFASAAQSSIVWDILTTKDASQLEMPSAYSSR